MLLSLLLQASPIPAMPAFPACSFDQTAKLVERKTDLPATAAAELERFFQGTQGIAEAGDYFESTDNIRFSDAPRARFVRAYGVGKFWFVWFERGGIGLSRQVVALGPWRGDDGKIGLYTLPGSHFSGDLCAASKAYLAGVRNAGG
ncbi:hypothetical protein [Sphingomonas sp. LM7]|uniref:hypothetical protein n=1 Tax=Sphingomonas sp. LM7 TaxID=1938607 RepID=UPI000983EEDE|nr:hypothetical protein [Sphingomonas sp. LM7]AQR74484.1 hypothetical protein BXU08_13220 [Sphingomonas sp. LM7]